MTQNHRLKTIEPHIDNKAHHRTADCTATTVSKIPLSKGNHNARLTTRLPTLHIDTTPDN